MTYISKRTAIHYLLAMTLLSVYGIQVCPFLDSLTPLQLLLPIIVAFAIQAIIRAAIEKQIKAQSLKEQVSVQFKIDLGLFLTSGLLLGVYNTLIHNFPIESGGKVLIGMSILGFLVACELALFREYQLAQYLSRHNLHIEPDDTPYPLTQKFSWFAVICSLSVIGVVFLVINKDLEWLVNTGNNIPLEVSQRYILGEIVFVVGIMMSYILAIILGYSRNLKFFIQAENHTLKQVAQGALDIQVPVTSNDEFGLMAKHTNKMIAALSQRTNELNITRDASILGLASLAETRDNETGGHILRTQNYVRALAEQMSGNPLYSALLDEKTIDLLYKSAPLHDVGKVGIPDNILLKPGKLTDDEFSVMKQHPQIGADALQVAENQLGSNSFLKTAREISLTHHEKWDGSGYPNGLKGEDIPISGRLMAVADVYDALISKRIYKPAFSHDKATAIILEGKGTHFDPAVIEAFTAIENRFIEIASEFSDGKEFGDENSSPIQQCIK